MKTWKVMLSSAMLVFGIACGDDDGEPFDSGPGVDDTGVDDTGVEDTGPGGDDMEMGGNTIADIAAATPDLSIVLGLAQRVGLDTALAGDTLELTVFAPANSAFDGIDTDALSDAEVTAILGNHVIAGAAIASGDIAEGITISDNFSMLSLIINKAGDTVNVNNATVTMADVTASNGVVHIIDQVMLPQSAADAAVNAGLSELVTAVGAAADLPDGGGTVLAALQNPEATWTVFAPTNDAFTAAAGALEGATPEDVRGVLLNHLLDSVVLAAGIPATATAVGGLDLTFDTAATPPTVNGQAIAITDIKVTNGVVHVIGGVLLAE